MRETATDDNVTIKLSLSATGNEAHGYQLKISLRFSRHEPTLGLTFTDTANNIFISALFKSVIQLKTNYTCNERGSFESPGRFTSEDAAIQAYNLFKQAFSTLLPPGAVLQNKPVSQSSRRRSSSAQPDSDSASATGSDLFNPLRRTSTAKPGDLQSPMPSPKQ